MFKEIENNRGNYEQETGPTLSKGEDHVTCQPKSLLSRIDWMGNLNPDLLR